jgi:hypothetical protein
MSISVSDKGLLSTHHFIFKNYQPVLDAIKNSTPASCKRTEVMASKRAGIKCSKWFRETLNGPHAGTIERLLQVISIIETQSKQHVLPPLIEVAKLNVPRGSQWVLRPSRSSLIISNGYIRQKTRGVSSCTCCLCSLAVICPLKMVKCRLLMTGQRLTPI